MQTLHLTDPDRYNISNPKCIYVFSFKSCFNPIVNKFPPGRV